MIQLETPFPNPGAIAEHDGKRCRILQHLPANIVLISMSGPAREMRVPFADLTNPAQLDDAVAAVLINPGEADTRRALWIASRLRDANQVTLADLHQDMASAARKGHVPICDRRDLAQLLRKMGWAWQRVARPAGASYGIYVRTSQPVAA